MKRLVAVTVGIWLSASMVAAANAAPANTSGTPKQPTGIQNSRKVMQARFDHEKKMQEVRKKAQTRKKQAQGVK